MCNVHFQLIVYGSFVRMKPLRLLENRCNDLNVRKYDYYYINIKYIDGMQKLLISFFVRNVFKPVEWAVKWGQLLYAVGQKVILLRWRKKPRIPFKTEIPINIKSFWKDGAKLTLSIKFCSKTVKEKTVPKKWTFSWSNIKYKKSVQSSVEKGRYNNVLLTLLMDTVLS